MHRGTESPITKSLGAPNKKALARLARSAHVRAMKMTTLIETKSEKPAITSRPASKRGRTELGWLHSYHTFSFGQYFDADQMGFRSLRVINDDIVEPGQGFGTHPHSDAEIFSYVIEGELQHKDSLGNGSVIKAGDLQYISAGSGLRHSEFNPSKKNRVHFLQIWLMPNISGGEPRYAEKTLGTAAKNNALTLLFAGQARDGAVQIRQDAEIYFGRLEKGHSLSTELAPGRHAWLHVIKGKITAGDETLAEGDGAAVSNTTRLNISADENAEFLLFDLA